LETRGKEEGGSGGGDYPKADSSRRSEKRGAMKTGENSIATPE